MDLEISTNGINNQNLERLSKVVNTSERFTSLKNELEVNVDPYGEQFTLPGGNNYKVDFLRESNSQEMIGSIEGFPNQIEPPSNIQNSGVDSSTIENKVNNLIITKVVTESIDELVDNVNKYRITGLYQVNNENFTGTGEGKTRIEASNNAKLDAENKYKFKL